MTNNSLIEVGERLKAAKNIAIFCHTRPDGDALGSAMALNLALKNAGKFAVMCLEEQLPAKYSFLKDFSEIERAIPSDAVFDTFVCLDCADVNRTGSFSKIFTSFRGVKINIDHHISNKMFGDYNYVCECSATCQIITELLHISGFEIDKNIANLLMLGLITDSGTFTHSDVSEQTFEAAALLRKRGADVNWLNYQLSRQSKFKALLFGKVISSMRFALDDKLAILIVNRADFDGAQIDGSLTEGFVDFPLTIDNVEVSVSLLEVKKRQYKISFRSKGIVNVNAVAAVFGGGGHILASGCMLNGELEEVIEKVTYAVYQNL